MKARCSNCGREYLTARARAGTDVACVGCGALNDGAGATRPPAREVAPARAGDPVAERGKAKVVGVKRRAPSRPAEQTVPSAARPPRDDADDARLARILGLIAIGLFALALLVAIGLFAVQRLGARPKAVDWSATQLAVPQIASDRGTGTGFIVEDRRQLWLVTNYHVVEGVEHVDAIFRSPTDGTVLERVARVPTREFRVHPRFLEVKEGSPDQREFDLAAVSVESYRDQLAKIGVVPLAIAPSDDLVAGARVVALGHLASEVFDLSAEGDGDARGIATHSLFDGVLSGIRRAPGKPTLVQTSANYGNGCSGGPLMLEESRKVAAVNTWSDVNEDGTTKAGVRFGLAADQIIDVIRDGPALASIETRMLEATQEPLPPYGVVDEARAWGTFVDFQLVQQALVKGGWKFTGRAIGATDARGNDVHRHRVIGLGGVEVAVVVIARDRAINMDLTGLAGVQFRGDAGSAGASRRGALTFLVTPEGSANAASFEQGFELNISLASSFLGAPVPSRYLVMVFERPTAGGTAAPSPPAPPSPSPPALPAPQAPAPQPPSAPQAPNASAFPVPPTTCDPSAGRLPHAPFR